MERFTTGWIVGVDLSSFLLNLAQRKTYHAQTSLLQCFGETTPFKNAVFDKVYCSEVLEHVPQPEIICRETHRVLKDGGRFVVSVPNEDCINFYKSLSRRLFVDALIRRLSGYRYATDMTDEWHLQNFNRDLLEQVLEKYFIVEKLIFVPSPLIPIRIVAQCRRR
jgi:ubiquinone/menaquinone biosynthesis C-methylase UbiE